MSLRKSIAACVRGIRKGEIACRADLILSIDESIARGKAYVKAGAELFFPHGTPRSFTPRNVRHIAESVGVPTLVNLPLLKEEKGKRPSASDFDDSLAKIVLFPRDIVNAGIAASVRALQEIKKTGRAPKVPNYASDPKLGDLSRLRKVLPTLRTTFLSSSTYEDLGPDTVPIVDLPLSELRNYDPQLTRTNDFERFWRENIRLAEEQPLNEKWTDIEFFTRRIKVSKVTFDGFSDKSPISGFFIQGASGAETRPTLVQLHGYGGHKGRVTDHLGLISLPGSISR